MWQYLPLLSFFAMPIVSKYSYFVGMSIQAQLYAVVQCFHSSLLDSVSLACVPHCSSGIVPGCVHVLDRAVLNAFDSCSFSLLWIIGVNLLKLNFGPRKKLKTRKNNRCLSLEEFHYSLIPLGGKKKRLPKR